MFIPQPQPSPDLDRSDNLWVPVRAGVVFIEPGGGLCRGAQSPIPEATPLFLGTLDGVGVWALDLAASPDEDVPSISDPAENDFEPVPLRQLYGRLNDEQWQVAGRAEQITHYEHTHRFCGRCGSATETNPADRSKQCPKCHLLAFPRLSPAMIVLVEREDKALLAWGSQFPGRFYSVLAGFVEPGENLEDAVAREVREEVAIEVSDIAYFGSQPWPFPHSLMCGFRCNWAAGEIEIAEDEIVEAAWFSPDDLPPCPRGGMSIAGWLIDDWLKRHGI